MKKIVIYARFSSENQREESIDAQLRACKDYAKNHKYLVVGEYVDRAFTGTNDNRPEFQKMIEDSRKGNFELVLVHKLDRFSRNVEQTIRYISELRDSGVELKSVIEQFDNTPEGEFMRNMMSNISQYYVRNLAREVMKGMKENAYKCLHVGGIPPLGYYVDLDKKYQIDEKEASIVKKIFELYIDGNTHQKIITELNSLGYRNKKGTEWTKNSILSILRNEKYIGTYVWNRVVAKNSKGKRNGHREKPVEEVIRIPNGIPAIIHTETFQKVQGIIAAVYQSVFGQDAYPSLEEKAANLLYFMIKDHPYADGCKRIAASLFLEFLDKNNAFLISKASRYDIKGGICMKRNYWALLVFALIIVLQWIGLGFYGQIRFIFLIIILVLIVLFAILVRK